MDEQTLMQKALEQPPEETERMSDADFEEMIGQIDGYKQLRDELKAELIHLVYSGSGDKERIDELKTDIEGLDFEIEGREEESAETIPVTLENVQRMLDEKGVEDPKTKALMLKLIDQYRAEEEVVPVSGESSTRAKIECEIKIAHIYLATERYKDEGINSLWDALEMAIQRDTFQDLEQSIRELIAQNSK